MTLFSSSRLSFSKIPKLSALDAAAIIPADLEGFDEEQRERVSNEAVAMP